MEATSYLLAVMLVVMGGCLQTTLTARILALCAVNSKSHSLWCYNYMAALAQRGHQITVLGVDKPTIEIPNLKTFIASEVYEMFNYENSSTWDLDQDSMFFKLRWMHPMFSSSSMLATTGIMKSQALKDLIASYKHEKKPFDLIIHDHINADALLGLVPLFGNPPLLLATVFGSPQWMTTRVGNAFNPAYVPSMITTADQHMSFYERCVNTFYYIYVEWVFRYIIEPFQDSKMREVFGEDLPYVRDIAKRANVVLVNQHFAINGPRPSLPGVVGIPGLHINDAKPLPKEIQDFMDGANDGVILLSFGSNIDSKRLPNGIDQIIITALAQLPQRILWKWDKSLTNLPPNIKISKWHPQGDILVHPKMRLFISHCGLLSTQEAIYRKVPVLALPVCFDQMDNAKILLRMNLTIYLNIKTLKSEVLLNSIKEMLDNPMYKRNIERVGSLVADAPLTAAQTAVYWTEYVIRHQGAPHLRSAAADMPLHQLMLLDVLLLVLVTLLATVWILKLLLTLLLRNILGPHIRTIMHLLCDQSSTLSSVILRVLNVTNNKKTT